MQGRPIVDGGAFSPPNASPRLPRPTDGAAASGDNLTPRGGPRTRSVSSTNVPNNATLGSVRRRSPCHLRALAHLAHIFPLPAFPPFARVRIFGRPGRTCHRGHCGCRGLSRPVGVGASPALSSSVAQCGHRRRRDGRAVAVAGQPAVHSCDAARAAKQCPSPHHGYATPPPLYYAWPSYCPPTPYFSPRSGRRIRALPCIVLLPLPFFFTRLV